MRFYYGAVESAQHGAGHSAVRCADGAQLLGSLVCDATGHSRALVEYDKPFNPGKSGGRVKQLPVFCLLLSSQPVGPPPSQLPGAARPLPAPQASRPHAGLWPAAAELFHITRARPGLHARILPLSELRAPPRPPPARAAAGYQGAYGIVAEVESHPFELDSMLFMDWRDDHLDPYPALKAANSRWTSIVVHPMCG